MIETWRESLAADENAPARPCGQYLCFWLGAQSYALPVGEVREIRAPGAWSTLPGSQAWVLGVMNLRGLVIPLLDLRLRFGIAADPSVSPAPVLIVAALAGKLAGLLVDGVMDVAGIDDSAVRPAGAGSNLESRCVTGVASLGESVVIVLNASALLNWEAGPGGDGAPAGTGFRASDARRREGIDDVAMV